MRSHRIIDRFGAVLVICGALASAMMAFVFVKPNRIAAGQGKVLGALLDLPAAWMVAAVLVVAGAIALFIRKQLWRFAASCLVVVTLAFALGNIASVLLAGSASGRISIGGAFWILLALGLLLMADALVRLDLKPLPRLGVLGGFVLFLVLLFGSGSLNDLSVMREFSGRAEQFWREAVRHLALSFGSLLIAVVIGIPLGIFCHWHPRLRAAILQVLSLIQTIPSIALFGLLMLPLAWLAAHSPLAAALGIGGIGVAPALIALILYALLPVVANTVVGLSQVPQAVQDAARGMGFSQGQILAKVDLPLALPVILTGIRIVLVQNIGLVTVAALIGGGGFGLFVFQGINQTATDLVLLGALPTVALAFASAVVLDALVELSQRVPS